MSKPTTLAPLAGEEVSIAEALGRVTATAVFAGVAALTPFFADAAVFILFVASAWAGTLVIVFFAVAMGVLILIVEMRPPSASRAF